MLGVDNLPWQIGQNLLLTVITVESILHDDEASG